MKSAPVWTGVLAATSVVSASILPRTPGLDIETTSGQVTGTINASYPSVRQFLGIPFAQAPLKDLRFQPPQPLAGPSETPIDATKAPPACPQFSGNATTVYNSDAPEFSIQIPTSEDCLTLTVWTPTADACAANTETDAAGLPVFIWIYGGGFQTGGTEVPYQIPAEWIERTKSHIVVSIQYRLNIFGFPNAAGLDTANLGLLDQRAAVEWIRDNIAAFGGDKDRMVLWGQSAGAFSVDYYGFSYPADPIISGQIDDSGSVFSLPAQAPNPANFSFVASQVGCPSVATGASSEDELACVRGVPQDQLEAFLKQYSDAGTEPALSFNPVPDEKVVFADYDARYALGPGVGVANIPAIFGSNRDEGVSLVTYPADPNMPPDLAEAAQTTLSVFQCPAARSVNARTAAGLKTHRYFYEGNFTDVSPRYWQGAYHSSELPQVFGTRGEYRGPASAYEVQVSEAMQDLWLSFARDSQAASGWEDAGAGLVNVFAEGSPAGGSAVTTTNAVDLDGACAAGGFPTS